MLICMTHKAAARMRRLELRAQSVTIEVTHLGEPYGVWSARHRLTAVGDTHTIVECVNALWNDRPVGTPLKVGVVLGDLIPVRSATRPLFDEHVELERVSEAMDRINQKLGDHTVYLAGMHGAQPHDPMRIAFTQIPEVRRMHAMPASAALRHTPHER
ncbi:MAG: hypothetical protein QM811_07820 [Pirellulales bacterium]